MNHNDDYIVYKNVCVYFNTQMLYSMESICMSNEVWRL